MIVKRAICAPDDDCMARNFYFGADATMVSGSAAFSAAINVNPSALGLSDEQALAYAEIDAALQVAYHDAVTPSTRTPVAVARKDACVKAMQRSATMLSAIIHGTPAVDAAQLISLGLLPRPKHRRRNVPDTPPAVRVISVAGRVVKIRVCDRDSASGRSKPFAARGAHLYSYIGEKPPTDARAYHYEGFTSRTSTQITFPDRVAHGATVWLSASWMSARGETSIASEPISFTLQGGAVTPSTSQGLRAAA
jgi:hypothetical protein